MTPRVKSVRRKALHAVDGYEPFREFWFCLCGETFGKLDKILEHIDRTKQRRASLRKITP